VNGSLDSCSSAIRLSWNAYLSVPYAVNSYDVYENVSGSTWRNIATTTDTILTIRQFESDVVYRYKIIANLAGGLQSESNIASVDTKMQRPPSWINADYATVNNSNKIELSFTFDQESEIYNFSLERKDIDGAYAQIASIESRNGHIEYEDFVAQTNKEYLYRIAAINLCGNAAIYSNEASNIVLRQETDENLVTLTWNRYRNWEGGIEEQILQIDFGDGYRDYMMISGVDSSITINYSDIIEEINSSMIGVRIKAIEGVNSHVTSGESYSQRLSLTPKEEITVPNVFTPDGNLINDFFYPVLSFVPTQYQLIICDLNRKKVFETTDYKAQWDGTYNGARLPEGIYLWFLNVTTPSDKKISDTGTITIVKND
ncbi:MAG: gliding motility-associated C-terminal domain-containing protein, partial [Bacteroidales bacterium]|nr:gliding motility-associated C-terminal domain-containing protein [Bacteroidales bacterium]